MKKTVVVNNQKPKKCGILLLIIFCTCFCGTSIAQSYTDDCRNKWLESFMIYSVGNIDSVSLSREIMSVLDTCNLDTARGIVYISKVKFEKKNLMGYKPIEQATYHWYSICPDTTAIYTYKPSSSYILIPPIFPLIVLKVLYSSALYYNDFCFIPKLRIGFKGSEYSMGEGNSETDKLIVKNLNKSYKKWIKELEKSSIGKLREEGKHPLYYSDLEWKMITK